MRQSFVWAALAAACAASALTAQPSAADGRLLRARHATRMSQIKVFNPAGAVRLVGWEHDSIVVRGRGPTTKAFYLYGNDAQMKLGFEEPADGKPMPHFDLVVYFPKGSQVSVKTVTGDIIASDASGWFYTVGGNIRLSGSATTLDVLSMSGNVDLDVITPWVRARTGDGNLLVRGEPQDVDASTIAGTLGVSSSAILRGQFGSVTGGIHYAGSPAAGAVFDFSNHSGAIEFSLARSVSGVFSLSSVVGSIENGFSQIRPTASTPHSVRLSLGRGGAQVTARTFKGTIRLRPE